MRNIKESLRGLQKTLTRREVFRNMLYIGGVATGAMTGLDAVTLNRDVTLQAQQDKLKDPNISNDFEQHPPLNLYARYPLRSLRPLALAIIAALVWGKHTSLANDQNKISSS